jgi:methylmalonyl-CoA mutase
MTNSVTFTEEFPEQTYAAWRELAEQDLKGAPFEKRLVTRLLEGIAIQPLYVAEAGAPNQAGYPGMSPYVRGATPLGSARANWQIVQEHRHANPQLANAAILGDLKHGATSVVVSLAPRLLDTLPKSNCGCGGGVLVDDVDQLDVALRDVNLAGTPVQITASTGFYSAAAALSALQQKRGIDPAKRLGAFNADPLGALAARGLSYRNAEIALAQAASLAATTSTSFPRMTALQVSTVPYDNAGAHAVQELAAAIATGVEYLRACEAQGLAPEAAAKQIQFTLAIGCDQFLEIAKLRALRALWNRVLEACGVASAQRRMKLHARTSRRVLTKRDPWVNLLRTTIGCFSAAVGGAELITVLPFDDVLGPSDELARRIARNVQVVLAEESQIGKVADPAGGSFYVESLTRELAERAWATLQSIEAEGGMLSALRSGSFKRAIDATNELRQKDLAKRKSPITGVSEYPALREQPVTREPYDSSEIERAIKATRTERAAKTSLDSLAQAVAGANGQNRFGNAVAALLAGATRDQIETALGNQEETVEQFHLRRFAAGFEKLRDASDAALRDKGQRPRIFLANMGPIAVHTARAGFAQNFFEAGGFEALGNDGFSAAEQAVAAFKASGTRLAIICSSDGWYETGVAALAAALKQAGAKTLFLAGNPGAQEKAYRDAGVDQFIFMGCDVLATLTQLAQAEGLAL